jgi:hypothetical protein
MCGACFGASFCGAHGCGWLDVLRSSCYSLFVCDINKHAQFTRQSTNILTSHGTTSPNTHQARHSTKRAAPSWVHPITDLQLQRVMHPRKRPSRRDGCCGTPWTLCWPTFVPATHSNHHHHHHHHHLQKPFISLLEIPACFLWKVRGSRR